MNRVKLFLKNEAVTVISFILAVVSGFFVPFDKTYLSYVDYRTLALLFCLMAVTAGLNALGVFRALASFLLKKSGSSRGLSLMLVWLCFVFSTVITNDVALITFVPFTITALKLCGRQSKLPWLITLETVAANLGSMLTPIGNPQNLYLFSYFHLDFSTFFRAVAPYGFFSLLLLTVISLWGKKESVNVEGEAAALNFSAKEKGKLTAYALLFVLALLTVFRVIPYYITLGITLAALLCLDRGTIGKVDYSLLLTFVFLFVFIGNLGRIESIEQFLSAKVRGNEVICGVLCSQVFSNVPTAILLSGFTLNASGLLTGVNLGGLGTLIASMASLISYKFVAKEKLGSGKYIGIFTAVNLVFLVILLALYYLTELVF